ncbi:hypothetical protein FM036_30300 [Nostoc sp. HG1]|nr:hypothetical protein [Nostoc sp. HG1]
MTKIRLYLDEDSIKNSLVVALRNAGVDVITAADANKLSCTDEEQLIWATEDNRVIYSFNVGDFCRLHILYMVEGRNHGGIILSKQRYSVGDQLRGILGLIDAVSAEDMRNQQVFLGNYVRGE